MNTKRITVLSWVFPGLEKKRCYDDIFPPSSSAVAVPSWLMTILTPSTFSVCISAFPISNRVKINFECWAHYDTTSSNTNKQFNTAISDGVSHGFFCSANHIHRYGSSLGNGFILKLSPESRMCRDKQIVMTRLTSWSRWLWPCELFVPNSSDGGCFHVWTW